MQTEVGVPIPKVNRYNFADWPVGGSKYYGLLSEVEACASAAYSYARWHKNGLKMTRRKEGDGYRIWRIK